jgi:putative colanic acid biosynthesis acetyltransferase WcaF
MTQFYDDQKGSEKSNSFFGLNRNLATFNKNQKASMSNFFRVASWYSFEHLFFVRWFFPSRLRPQFLRFWGADIGKMVLIRRGVRIHFPWNLRIGDNCWIGEETWFINHELINIQSNVAISQRVIICSGSHDYRSSSLEYAHKPVTIKNGAWICLDAKVLPGITIGECSVVSAGEIVRNSLPDYSMLVGGQVRPIDPPN